MSPGTFLRSHVGFLKILLVRHAALLSSVILFFVTSGDASDMLPDSHPQRIMTVQASQTSIKARETSLSALNPFSSSEKGPYTKRVAIVDGL